MRKPTHWILTRSDTNQAVQPLEIARGLKFCILEVEVLYFPSSENKGADQLRGYREADLRLCFRICKMLVFTQRGSNIIDTNSPNDICRYLVGRAITKYCLLKVYNAMAYIYVFPKEVVVSQLLRCDTVVRVDRDSREI